MSTVTKPRNIVSPPREAKETSFRAAVRNNLSKVANALGLDAFDRDELLDMADSDRVLSHWKDLANAGYGHSISEWEWNKHVRSAARDCANKWGRI